MKYKTPREIAAATQLSGNLYDSGIPYLVVFHVFEISGPSREVYVVFGLCNNS